MKFRCERDTLADAVATAQRAVASRTGAMPVLSGLRVTLTPGSLELVGTDLELTIRVRIPAETDGEGSAVVPARLFSEIVRQLEGDTVSGRAGRRRRPHRGRPVQDDAAHLVGGRVPASPGGRARAACAWRRPRSPRRCARWCRERRVTTPDRSSPGCCSPRRPAGLRLVATDSYRLALRDLQGVSMLEEGQKVLVAAKGLGEVQRLLSSETGEIDVVLGEREVVFRVGTTEVTTRLIEGEFPNYQQLIPSGYPNRLTVSRDALQAAVNRVRLVGQSKDTAPIRLGMNARGARAVGDRAGRRRGPRVGRGEVRGHRPHGGVQLAVPARRHRRGRVRRGRDRVDRPVEAGGDEGHRLGRLPLPAHAGADRVTRRGLTVPGLALADRLPLLRGSDAALPARRHGDLRGERPGQDQPARGGGLGGDGQVLPGGHRSPRWCGPAPRPAILRAEVVEGARVQLLEAEIRAAGRNRVQLNRHPLQRTRDLLGLMRVTVFAPDDLQLVKGGPAGRRDYLDDLLVAISPRYEAARADYERVLKQRNALLRGRPAR